MIRCKFRCNSVEPIENSSPPTSRVRMTAIHSPEVPEDEGFTKYTPSGELDVTINNPRALEQLQVGTYHYLDLTPAG